MKRTLFSSLEPSSVAWRCRIFEFWIAHLTSQMQQKLSIQFCRRKRWTSYVMRARSGKKMKRKIHHGMNELSQSVPAKMDVEITMTVAEEKSSSALFPIECCEYFMTNLSRSAKPFVNQMLQSNFLLSTSLLCFARLPFVFQLITKHLSWLHDRFSWLFDSLSLDGKRAFCKQFLVFLPLCMIGAISFDGKFSCLPCFPEIKNIFSFILKDEKWFSQLREILARRSRNLYVEGKTGQNFLCEKCCNLTKQKSWNLSINLMLCMFQAAKSCFPAMKIWECHR